ncbi:MAG: hypothetical protein DWQ42_08295 [Planctomycetota bacterium]|nr:MAG: hypothetical protein DWQ42_08295 [Planctomycetota bacterium]
MKLLKHTTLPLSVVIDCFVEALNAGANEQEHYGALYEIGEVLDNVNIDAWESLDSELAANFVKTLESLAMKTDEVEIADACRRNISRVHNKRFGPADDV